MVKINHNVLSQRYDWNYVEFQVLFDIWQSTYFVSIIINWEKLALTLPSAVKAKYVDLLMLESTRCQAQAFEEENKVHFSSFFFFNFFNSLTYLDIPLPSLFLLSPSKVIKNRHFIKKQKVMYQFFFNYRQMTLNIISPFLWTISSLYFCDFFSFRFLSPHYSLLLPPCTLSDTFHMSSILLTLSEKRRMQIGENGEKQGVQGKAHQTSSSNCVPFQEISLT